MAKVNGVWAIDVGRCALKALKCRLDGTAVVAEGFDYIEYPKLLTQPDADAPQLVREALQQFVSRNDLKGDKIVISVPGEAGLAKFFKPPPVDVKKIADIVKYEARQQIPYQLDEVIWDYQQMPGGQEVDGFAMESEIGLFAMKREQVTKALAPFRNAEVEVDVIQLSPMAVYNFYTRDMAPQQKEGFVYQADKPPGSVAVLSIGVDTSDLVVTDGFRLWQRNVPLGGSHFTKQLSKELKLTFGKAEQLKRNPRQAEDPKAVFQAMRPVFGDIVTEMQRSVGFFHSLYKKATVEKVLLLGNTSKLPGLTQYLGKHLGLDVIEFESFSKLSGAKVIASPAFKENLPSFAVCYGLCLQGLGQSKVFTNLLPRELVTQRLIKAKKPWAVAGVAAISLACAVNFFFHYQQWNKVHPQFMERDEAGNPVTWETALSQAAGVSTTSGGLLQRDVESETQLNNLRAIKTEVVGSADRRVLWLELMRAINEALPAMDPVKNRVQPGQIPDPKVLPFGERQDLKIEYVETQRFNDLSLWFTENVKRRYLEFHPQVAEELLKKMAAADPNAPAANPAAGPLDPNAGQPGGIAGEGGAGPVGEDVLGESNVSAVPLPPPTGPGWVIEIGGYHFYNERPAEGGSAHLKNTLLYNLEYGGVDLPLGPGGKMERFTFKELGIDYSILVNNNTIDREFRLPNPNYVPPANAANAGFGEGGAGPAAAPPAGAAADGENVPYFKVPRYDFVVQFAWQEKPLFSRLEERERKAREAAAAAPANGGQPPAAAVAPGAAPPAS